MQYFEIGKIVNTLGLKGEIKVIPITDDPKRFELIKEIEVFKANGTPQGTYSIEKVRYHKQFIILKLKEISDINAALLLKTTSIKIPKEKALPLEEDQYYLSDLYGLKVVTDEGCDLGVIKDIIFTGANDVYIVEKQGEKDLLIPAIKQCILNVDLDNKIMTIHLMKGLK